MTAEGAPRDKRGSSGWKDVHPRGRGQLGAGRAVHGCQDWGRRSAEGGGALWNILFFR